MDTVVWKDDEVPALSEPISSRVFLIGKTSVFQVKD